MTAGHLDAALLAEYDEGLLPAQRAAEIQAHVAECTTCSGTLARLGALSSQLRAVPDRLPVPEHVVARIDAALAAEHESTTARRGSRSAGVRPLVRWAPRLLGAAALVGAIGFAGYVVGSGSGDDGAEQGASGGAETLAEAPDSPPAGDVAADSDGEQAVPQSLGQVDLAALVAQIQAVAAPSPTASAGGDESAYAGGRSDLGSICGDTLASELDRELIGFAATDIGGGRVLVVVAGGGPETAQGWVLPTCDSGTTDAVAERTVVLE